MTTSKPLSPESNTLGEKIGKFINRHNQMPTGELWKEVQRLGKETQLQVFKIAKEGIHHDSHEEIISKMEAIL